MTAWSNKLIADYSERWTIIRDDCIRCGDERGAGEADDHIKIAAGMLARRPT